MIGIGNEQLGPQAGKDLGRKGPDGPVGGHRDKGRGFDGAVGGRYPAGSGRPFPGQELKGEFIHSSLVFKNFRIEFFGAGGAKSVAEIDFRVFPEIGFDLIPVALVIPYLFAGSTNGQQAAQLFDFG